MKKLLMILAILVAFVASASAQTPSSPVKVYAGGALSIPTSDFGTAFKTGWHGSLGAGFDISPMFELVAKVEYHTFKFDFDPLLSDYGGGTNKMLMFGGDIKWNPSAPAFPVAPYVLGGVGLANIKQSEFTGPASLSLSLLNELISESQTQFYWNLGAGFQLKTGPAFSLFAQARYVSIASGGGSTGFIPVTIGLKFF